MKDMIRYLSGYARISVQGIHAERFLNLCNYHKIELWDMKYCSGIYEMNISISGLRRLKPIIRKTNTSVHIMNKEGLPFILHRYRNRQCFVLCSLCCFFLLYISTFFIWGIQIEGEMFYTEEHIIEKLKECNMSLGTRKAAIDCNRIAEYLRTEFENIIWTSVYVDGANLKIHLKENNREYEMTEDKEIPQEIVADCDGIILEIVTRKGVPKVHIGDEVKAGDILVSGELAILNDAGEAVMYEYVTPDAIIYIQTDIEYLDEISLEYSEKMYTDRYYSSFWIETKNNLFCFGDRKSIYEKFSVETEKLKGISDITFGKKTIREYNVIEEKYTEKEYQTILSDNYHKFCKEIEKKGVQILENSVKIYTESAQAFAKGRLIVKKETGFKRNMIRKEVQEGKIYGNP